MKHFTVEIPSGRKVAFFIFLVTSSEMENYCQIGSHSYTIIPVSTVDFCLFLVLLIYKNIEFILMLLLVSDYLFTIAADFHIHSLEICCSIAVFIVWRTRINRKIYSFTISIFTIYPLSVKA